MNGVEHQEEASGLLDDPIQVLVQVLKILFEDLANGVAEIRSEHRPVSSFFISLSFIFLGAPIVLRKE